MRLIAATLVALSLAGASGSARLIDGERRSQGHDARAPSAATMAINGDAAPDGVETDGEPGHVLDGGRILEWLTRAVDAAIEWLRTHATVSIHAEGLAITSPAFVQNAAIPAEYTCDGSGRNPPLVFAGVPPGAKSLALIVDDPDVPSYLQSDNLYVHWAKWDLPPGAGGIAEGRAEGGINEDGPGYVPPCPPGEHRYVFTLFALDIVLGPGVIMSSAADLQRAMEGHVLAQAALVGRYRRPGTGLSNPLVIVFGVTALFGAYRVGKVLLGRRAA